MLHAAIGVQLGDFRLDTYEVTVGRFRQFVNAGMGTSANPPAAGAGARMLNGMPGQGGWNPAANVSLSPDLATLFAETGIPSIAGNVQKLEEPGRPDLRQSNRGPGTGIPLDHMMLPFNIEKGGNRSTAWPVSLPAAGRTPEYEAVWKETARQVREHLDRDPNWRKVTKIAFLDGLDESYNEDAYEKMIYYGRLLHGAMGRKWFKYPIDGGYSWQAMEKLSQEVDLWVCHTVAWDAEKMDHFRKRGDVL